MFKKPLLLAIVFFSLFFSFLTPSYASAERGNRVFGGSSANPQSWPFIVSLQQAAEPNSYWGHFCGGSLIRPRWVLTARHCVEENNASGIDIVSGRSNLKTLTGQRITVLRVLKYSGSGFKNSDLALLYLSKASKSKTINVSGSKPPIGSMTSFAGWGVTPTSFPNRLQTASAPVYSDQLCQAVYGDNFNPRLQVCVGYPNSGKDTCQGDSGGPLIFNGRLVGVVGSREGCALPGKPGLYGLPGPVLKWINSNIKKPPLIKKFRSPIKETSKEPKLSVDVTGSVDDTKTPGVFNANIFVSSDYHIDQLSVSFVGAKDRTCVGAECFLSGQWFRPQLEYGSKTASITVAQTTSRCVKINFSAKIREKGAPTIFGQGSVCK